MPDGQEKVCVLCGQSCAGQARIKNAQGQYAHQACAQAQQAKATKPSAPAKADLGQDDDDLMGALLDDLPAPAAEPVGASGARVGCPGCGSALVPGQVICMSCGFNTQSGKAGKTRVVVPKAGKPAGESGLAGKAGEFAKAGTTFLLGSLLGGALGGAIGAAVWAVIVVVTHYEIGIIAVGVGVACGMGTAIGSRGQTGMMTGLIAVVFTIVSICAGKFFAVSYIVNSMTGGDPAAMFEQMTEEQLAMYMHRSLGKSMIEEDLDGGDISQAQADEYHELLDYGIYPDDFPPEIVSAAEIQWGEMNEEEQAAAIQQEKDWVADNADEVSASLTAGMFIRSFGLFDLLWFFLAIGAGWKLGSGGED
jgi:hypothetical protein